MSQAATTSIEVTPGICGGKPRIAGTRIKVSLIAVLSESNRLIPDEIVEAYPHLSLAQVHAALAYYWEHQETIEREIREDATFVSSLRAKLEEDVTSDSPGNASDGDSVSSRWKREQGGST